MTVDRPARPSVELVERGFTRIPASGAGLRTLQSAARAFNALGMRPTASWCADYFSYSLVNARKDVALDIEHSGRFFNVQIFPPLARLLDVALQAPSRAERDEVLNPRLSRLRLGDQLLLDRSRSLRRVSSTLGDHHEGMCRNIAKIRFGGRHWVALLRQVRAIERQLGFARWNLSPDLHFLTSYQSRDAVFALAGQVPSHRDTLVVEREVLICIQLTTGLARWTVGRELDSLWSVTQQVGDLVALDNFGQMRRGARRRNPIHHIEAGPTGRNSLLFSFTGANHARALRFLDEYGAGIGWSPARARV